MEILNEVSLNVKMISAEMHKMQMDESDKRTLEQRLPKNCGKDLMRYGISLEHLIRLARPQNEEDVLGVGVKNAEMTTVGVRMVSYVEEHHQLHSVASDLRLRASTSNPSSCSFLAVSGMQHSMK